MNGRKHLLLGILLGCSITYLSSLLTTHLTQSQEQGLAHNASVPSGWVLWASTPSSKNMELHGNLPPHVKSIALSLKVSDLKQIQKQGCSPTRGVSASMALELEGETPILWRLPLMLPQELSCQLVLRSNHQKQMPTLIEQEQDRS